MFGISFGEILLIFIVALIVFGPKQLATIASSTITIFRSLQRHIWAIRHDLYHKSGVADISQVKHSVFSAYTNIKENIILSSPLAASTSHYIETKSGLPRCARNDNAAISIRKYTDESFIQPELDFEQQPELF